MLKRIIAAMALCIAIGVTGVKLLSSSATGATLNKFDIHTDSKKNQVELTIYVDQKAEIETNRKGNVYTLNLKNTNISKDLVERGLPVVIDNENKLLARAVPLKEGGAKIIIPNMPKGDYQVTISQKSKSANASEGGQAFSQIATYTETLGDNRLEQPKPMTVQAPVANQYKGPDQNLLAQIKNNAMPSLYTTKVVPQPAPIAMPKIVSAPALVNPVDVNPSTSAPVQNRRNSTKVSKVRAEKPQPKLQLAVAPVQRKSKVKPSPQPITKKAQPKLQIVAAPVEQFAAQPSSQLVAQPAFIPVATAKQSTIKISSKPAPTNKKLPAQQQVQSPQLKMPQVQPMYRQQDNVIAVAKTTNDAQPMTMMAMADPATEYNAKHNQISIVPYAEKMLSQQTQSAERPLSERYEVAPKLEKQQTFSFLDPKAFQPDPIAKSTYLSPLKIKPMLANRPVPNAGPKINFLNTESQFEKIAKRFPKPRLEPESTPMVVSNTQVTSPSRLQTASSYTTPSGALVMSNPYVQQPQQMQSPVSALYFEEDNVRGSGATYSAPSVNPWYVNEADQAMMNEADAYSVTDIPDLTDESLLTDGMPESTAVSTTWVQEVVSAMQSMPVWVYVLVALFFGGIGLFALAGAALMMRLAYQSQVLKQPLIQVNQPAVNPSVMTPNGYGYYSGGYPQQTGDETPAVKLAYTEDGNASLFEDTVSDDGNYLGNKRTSHDVKDAVNQSVLLRFPSGGRGIKSFRTPNRRAK